VNKERQEKNSKRLLDLDRTFYSQIRQFFLSRKEAFANDQVGNQRLMYQLANVQKSIEQLYKHREKKVLILALNDSRSDSQCPEVSDMVPHEKKLYGALIKVLNEHRDLYYLPLFTDEKGAAPPSVLVESPAPVKVDEAAPNDKDDGLVELEFLADIPRTLGMDAKEYGPFRRGEKARIPAANAENLINRGKARSAEA